jgi:hypothetical protein
MATLARTLQRVGFNVDTSELEAVCIFSGIGLLLSLIVVFFGVGIVNF